MAKKMRPCIEDGERRKDPGRVRKPKDLPGLFEAPIWAHRHMRRQGLNPCSVEDWLDFKGNCE